MAQYRAELSRQGAIVATWRRRSDRPVGPYFRLVCRDGDGRQRSVYLGVAGTVVNDAQAALARLQASRNERRVLNQLHQHAKSGLVTAKRQIDEELKALGLRRQGAEIRGWSNLPKKTACNSQ
jgi:hypothetical protein